MNRRGKELLAEQMRSITPPRNDLGMALVAVFIAGIVLFAGPRQPVAPHDAMAALSLPHEGLLQR